MTLNALRLGQVRPAGWLAAVLTAEWEARHDEVADEQRTAWLQRAFLVGGGKGRIVAKAWLNRVLAAADAFSPPVLAALQTYLDATDDPRLREVVAPGPSQQEAAAVYALAEHLEAQPERPWAEILRSQLWLDPRGARLALYAPAVAKFAIGGQVVSLEIDTESAESLSVEVRVYPETSLEFSLFVRIPDRVAGCLISGDGMSNLPEPVDGWLEMHRTWTRGDTFTLAFEEPS